MKVKEIPSCRKKTETSKVKNKKKRKQSKGVKSIEKV
jgi:hypothetical protein